jgi:AcrR family transcriptional regulator
MASTMTDRPSGQTDGKTADRGPATQLRRVPRQERGRVRVEKILDAAADVISNVGVEAATTNAIAAHANTSVGSLYQFFPNKEAIVEALAVRFNTELRQLNDTVLSPSAMTAPLPELVNGVVDSLLHFHEVNPAYRYVYQATHQSGGSPVTKEAELHKAVVGRVEELLRTRKPSMESTTKHLHATVSVLAVHALLGFAMTASPGTRDGIVEELKGMIVTYLADAIDGRRNGTPVETAA